MKTSQKKPNQDHRQMPNDFPMKLTKSPLLKGRGGTVLEKEALPGAFLLKHSREADASIL